MKINQVEELVGIAKKNIRFYEEEGLIHPKRNSDNGYRDYTLDDVEILQKIKFLRKLSVPIEEIRKLQSKHLTLEDCLERHRIFLEREQKNVECKIQICKEIVEKSEKLESIQVTEYLEDMEKFEKDGVRFENLHKKDKYNKRITASIIAAVFMIAISIFTMFLYGYRCRTTEDKPPWIATVILIALPIAIVIGVIIALKQRIREIKGTIVQTKNLGRDFMAAMKNLVGGELVGYTEMLNEARQIAMKRMVDEAKEMGADAVIGVRYSSASMMQGAAEVVAYGTAVKYK